MIDLHSHSAASDGILPPADAARHAAEKNLSVWALTDHDTVDGLWDAARACLESGVQFVPGIEVNIAWPSMGEFHLLGLGLRTYSDDLRGVVEFLSDDRRARNSEIVRKMNADGIHVSLAEIEGMFAFSQIGRPHFAQYLVRAGVVRDVQEAFTRFLGSGRPWYVPHNGEDLDVAVAAIRSAGGVPVIAHPLSLYLSWGRLEEELARIHAHGVAGLEAWHPGARVAEAQRLEALARKLGMFVTAGSDFHGKGVRADRHLGKTSGGKKIDSRFWTDELLPALGNFDFRTTQWAQEQRPAADATQSPGG